MMQHDLGSSFFERMQRFVGDPVVVFLVLALLSIGLVMVTSASMAVAEQRLGDPFYYCWRQLIYIGLGTVAAFVILRIPFGLWYASGHWLLLLGLLLLVLVLVPGIGKVVNGSRRWIDLGFMAIQISELVKLLWVIYLASYLARFYDQVRGEFKGFVKPMIVLALISFLLLMEPDFGATVVMSVTCMSMLFLAGVRWRIIWGMVLVGGSLFAALIVSAPYRMKRLTGFLDPWGDQYDTGYQLTQSLIAFGQGGWFGVGLGKSVQKLFYLPEAYTDFVFAVIAEEFGLLGVIVIMVLFLLLCVRLFMLAQQALAVNQLFAGFLVFGIATWLSLQALISMGVNTGMLPTKGLTLPFISYGGSSLVINMVTVALALRVGQRLRHPNQMMDRVL